MGWTIPTDIIAQDAQDHILSWTPTEPNATRVRYSGGTKGVTGEWKDRTEERVEIAVAIFRRRKPRKEQTSGDKFTNEFVAVFVDDLLDDNDIVEWNGLVLEVYEMKPTELHGETTYRRAYLRKKQR